MTALSITSPPCNPSPPARLNDAGLFEVNFHDERYLPFEALASSLAGASKCQKKTMPLILKRYRTQSCT